MEWLKQISVLINSGLLIAIIVSSTILSSSVHIFAVSKIRKNICKSFQIFTGPLSYWGRVKNICVSKLTIIGPCNGLSVDRRQAIISTNDGILLIGHLGTNFSEILIEIHAFSFTKIHLKMSSWKWRPFFLGLNVLLCVDMWFLMSKTYIMECFSPLTPVIYVYTMKICTWLIVLVFSLVRSSGLGAWNSSDIFISNRQGRCTGTATWLLPSCLANPTLLSWRYHYCVFR